MRRRPNLFIVGVAKGGTTSLHAQLGRHPEVFMSTPKEPHFLADISAAPQATHTLNRVADLDSYLDLFARTVAPIRGESSTSYWWRPETAGAIAEFSRAARVVIILRDPVDRAFSHYLNDLRDGHEERDFSETLDDVRPGPDSLRWGDPMLRLELGFYAERLSRYLEVFGDRCRVLVYEDSEGEGIEAVDQVLTFLGLASTAESAQRVQRLNGHRMPRGAMARTVMRTPFIRTTARAIIPGRLRSRAYDALLADAEKPSASPESINRLSRLYAADTENVEKLLGRPLPWRSHSECRRSASKANHATD